jgi:YidC/Oxa1 family membrane protein insertase
MRVTLFPLVVLQIRTVRAITAGPPGMHLHHLTKLTIQEYIKSPSTRPKTLRLYIKGLRGLSKMFNLRPWRALLAPAVHLPVLFTFMLATRDMVRGDVYDMSTGGALWFSDLGAVDATMILPAVAVGVTYWNLEQSFGRVDAVTATQVFREFFQVGVLCSLPFVVNLPAGVFMLWIPSGLYTMTQTSFLRTSFVQSLVMRSLPPPLPLGPDGAPLGSKENDKGKPPKLSQQPPSKLKKRVPFPMRVNNEASDDNDSKGSK